MHTFSIVIPTYKLLSPQNQRYFSGLVTSLVKSLASVRSLLKEIVVVNDLPTEDVSSFVTTIFRENDLLPYLCLVQNTINKSQAQSRNIGFEKTTGEYIHFIDQDDCIAPDFYAKLLPSTADILLAKVQLLLGESILDFTRPRTEQLYKSAKSIADLSRFLMTNIALSPGQYLVNRSSVILVGGFPMLENKGSDDYGFMFELALHKTSLFYCPKTFFLHRIHVLQGKNQLNIQASFQEFLTKISSKELPLQLKIIRFIRLHSWIGKILGVTFFLYYFYRRKL